MKKLTKRLVRSFVNMDVNDLTDITKTPYNTAANHLGNDKVEVGEEARTLAYSLCEEGMEPEVNLFFDHVRLFYSILVKTLYNQEVPIHLHSLVRLENFESFRASHIQRLPKCSCPSCEEVTSITAVWEAGGIETEAIDFQMADEADLPQDTSVDAFWASLHDEKKLDQPLQCTPTFLPW